MADSNIDTLSDLDPEMYDSDDDLLFQICSQSYEEITIDQDLLYENVNCSRVQSWSERLLSDINNKRELNLIISRFNEIDSYMIQSTNEIKKIEEELNELKNTNKSKEQIKSELKKLIKKLNDLNDIGIRHRIYLDLSKTKISHPKENNNIKKIKKIQKELMKLDLKFCYHVGNK